MEEHLEPTEAPSERTPEKPRGRVSEFMQRWLQRRLEPLNFGWERPNGSFDNVDEEAKEKDDERKTENKKPWQRFRKGFRKAIMGKLARPEFLPVEAETSQQPHVVEEPEPELRQATQEQSSTQEVEVPLRVEKQPEQAELEPLSLPEVVPAAHMAQVAERFVAPFRNEEKLTTPSLQQDNERSVENSRGTAAVASLLAFEYVGRHHADRKNRKLFRKEIKNFKQQQKVERLNLTKRLEKQAKTTNQELLNLQKQLGTFERPKIVTKYQETAERNRLASPQEASKSSTIEKLPDAEKVVHQVEQLKRPEAVLRQVEAAAEQSIPVEAVYERRHEAKAWEDEGVFGGTASSSEPIRLADALQQRLNIQTQNLSKQMQENPPSQTPTLYKNAVKSGFWGAIVILVFIVILFLVNS